MRLDKKSFLQIVSDNSDDYNIKINYKATCYYQAAHEQHAGKDESSTERTYYYRVSNRWLLCFDENGNLLPTGIKDLNYFCRIEKEPVCGFCGFYKTWEIVAASIVELEDDSDDDEDDSDDD